MIRALAGLTAVMLTGLIATAAVGLALAKRHNASREVQQPVAATKKAEAGPIHVRVVDGEGADAPDMAIEVHTWSQPPRSVSTDAQGRKLEVVPINLPRPLYHDGQRLPASYANFYIANGLVLVPTFNDKADRIALNILAGLFPDRDVIGIHSVDLVLGLGTLHCLSQQQPATPAG